MPIRTTPEAIEGIIEVDEAILLDPFIESASALVDEVCAPALKPDGVTLRYDATRLELIERYLAAHFYAVRDARKVSAQAKGVGASYEGRTGLMLLWSRYGQHAMLLDTNGGLAKLSKDMEKGAVMPTAGVTWIGRTPEERNV